MIFSLASALALGSLWALIPGSLFSALLVGRTALEDRTLQDELEGYKAYAWQVPYRLIPHLWWRGRCLECATSRLPDQSLCRREFAALRRWQCTGCP